MFKFIYLIVKNLPSTVMINKYRAKLYGRYFLSIGTNISIGRSVNIANIHNIKFGNNIQINAEVYLVASQGKIVIHDNVLIAPRCILQTQNHNYIKKSTLIKDQGTSYADITIERDVWLASNVIVLAGVTISEGCVIGAGAVVTKNTEPYGIYVGVPAKKIGERK